MSFYSSFFEDTSLQYTILYQRLELAPIITIFLAFNKIDFIELFIK